MQDKPQKTKPAGKVNVAVCLFAEPMLAAWIGTFQKLQKLINYDTHVTYPLLSLILYQKCRLQNKDIMMRIYAD
jgi:hypothetical protein